MLVLALITIQFCEVIQIRSNVRMIGTVGFLIYRQCALVERFGPLVLASGIVQSRQVAECRGHRRMIGSEDLLLNRQRTL